MIALALLLSCTPDTTPMDTEPTAVEETVQVTMLEGPPLLRRLSLDLRGVLPSVEELDAVEADPDLVWTYRDAFLEDPRLEDRLVELFHGYLYTLIADYEFSLGDYFPGETDFTSNQLNRHLGEQTVRYIARVAVEDRSWTEVVTGDTMLASPIIAQIQPVEWEESDTGWQEVPYTDGRPTAGVLTTNSFWQRYTSSNQNHNRGRAAALIRIFLCRDVLSRPVSFSNTGGNRTTEEIEEAVKSEPACLACHSSLDPIGATLFGYYTVPAEPVTYRPEREHLYRSRLGVEPAYFGTSVENIQDIGVLIAQDSRFTRCAVEQVATSLYARDLHDGDEPALDEIEEVFLDSDLRLKPAIAAVTETRAYREGSAELSMSDDAAVEHAPARLATPDLLSDSIFELTGFRWRLQQSDLLRLDFYGLRLVGGGVDGKTQLRSQRVPGVMWTLVSKRMAEATADFLVTSAQDTGTDGVLLNHATLDSGPGDPEFSAELEELHWRLTAERMEPDQLEALGTLFTEVEEATDREQAWMAVLSVMLRDPAFLFH